MSTPRSIPASPVTEWVEYCRCHNRRSVPIDFVTVGGFRLGRWEDRQRVARALGTLPLSRVQELDEVGFPWGDRHVRFDPVIAADSKCGVMLALLAAYREEHGHADVPANYVAPTGERLGQWLLRRLKKWRSDSLAEEERVPLAALGVSPSPRRRGPRTAPPRRLEARPSG